MNYMFLNQNKLTVIDYVPGSSGRLLMRLMAELDGDITYDNEKIMFGSVSNHPASREIDFYTLPKRYIEWYWHMQPAYDMNVVLDQIGCLSVALREGSKFYPNKHYQMINEKIYYGFHSWNQLYDVNKLHQNITVYSIVPQTDLGKHYQTQRAQHCWPNHYNENWQNALITFNNKPHKNIFDFCSLLMHKDTQTIIDWLQTNLKSCRTDKLKKIKLILQEYYEKVVDHV